MPTEQARRAREEELGGRVSALETDVSNLREEVRGLGVKVDATGADIQRSVGNLSKNVFDAINDVKRDYGKTGTYTLTHVVALLGGLFTMGVSFAALILTVCGAIGTLALQPIKESHAALDVGTAANFNLLTARIDRIQSAINAQAVQNKEIETQFRMERRVVEAELHELREVDRLNHTYGQELDRLRDNHLRERTGIGGGDSEPKINHEMPAQVPSAFSDKD